MSRPKVPQPTAREAVGIREVLAASAHLSDDAEAIRNYLDRLNEWWDQLQAAARVEVDSAWDPNLRRPDGSVIGHHAQRVMRDLGIKIPQPKGDA